MSRPEIQESAITSDRDDQILRLLRETCGQYLAASSLSHRLSLSHAAIERHVDELRRQGYEIEAHPHLGYRFLSSPDVLLSREIRHGLQTSVMGRQVYSYRRVRSTNEVASRIAQRGGSEGTMVVAEEQTAGRGRLGRAWHSPPGVGLWFSLILRPKVDPGRISTLAICGALAVAETVYERTHLPVQVKWPNDVMVRERKLAGVLTETQAELSRVRFVILGVGINVNLKIQELPERLRHRATSIQEELGRSVCRLDLLRDLLRKFEQMYGQFQEHGLAPFLNRWQQLSSILGRRVRVRRGVYDISGLAVDIDPTGALVLEEDDGRRERLLAGDVTLL